MTNNELAEMLSNGRIFSAVFIKADGTERKMVARTGVTKYLRGGGRKFDPKPRGLLSVFDMQKSAYRFVNLNTCKQIKANKEDICLFKD